jgi:uncharacterized protein
VRRVLAIDGGGVRGVIPAAFLARVEKTLGVRISDCFDLIVGTSTGGIVALGLGAGLGASEIRDFYVDRGARVFHGQRMLRAARRVVTAKYDPSRLRAELDAVFGDVRIGDSKTRLVIPSMDLTIGKVHLWKTAHNPRFTEDYKRPMVEAAMATAAAPTFFRAFVSEPGIPLIDGGVFANNPAGLAAVEAVGVLGWPRDEVAILSLGCGSEPLNVRSRGWWRHGIAGLSLKVTAIFMAGQSDASCGMAIHLIGDRANFKRIDPVLPSRRYGLDVAKAIPELAGLGAAEARRELPQIQDLFFASRTESFVPAHALRSPSE